MWTKQFLFNSRAFNTLGLSRAAFLLVAIIALPNIGLCQPVSLPFVPSAQKQEPTITTQESAGAELPENIRARAQQTLVEVKGLIEQGDARALLTQKQVKLEEIVSLCLQLEDSNKRLIQAQHLRSRAQEEGGKIVKEITSTYEELSFLRLAKLEQGLLKQGAREGSGFLLKESMERLIQIQTSELEDKEKQRRLIKDRLQAKADQSAESLAELELVQLDEQIARLTLQVRKQQLQVTEQIYIAGDETKKVVLDEIARLTGLVKFKQEDLDVIKKDISDRLDGVRENIKKTETNFSTWERKFEATNEASSGFSEFLPTLILRYQLDALRAEVQLLDKLNTIWDYRFSIWNEDPSSLRTRDRLDEFGVLSESLSAELDEYYQRIGSILRAGSALITTPEKFKTKIRELSDGAVNDSQDHISEIRYALALIDIVRAETKAKIQGGSLPVLSILQASWEGLHKVWNYEVWNIDETPLTVGKVSVVLVLLLVGFWLSGNIAARFGNFLVKKFDVASGPAAAFESITYYLMIVIVVVVALNIVHIPLTAFTFVGGAVAIGLGFGSQNIVNNFLSGMILFAEQPLRVGDTIEYNSIYGRVQQIGSRSTLLLTPDNSQVFVPNSALVESTVINWTRSDHSTRRKFRVGVAYGSDTRKVSDLLMRSVGQHGFVIKDPKPEIIFADFGDSALIFEVRFWLSLKSFAEALRVESDLRHMINRAFADAEIVMAFPQRDIHLDLAGPPIKVELSRSARKPVEDEE